MNFCAQYYGIAVVICPIEQKKRTMIYYFVTGTSRGIGSALVNAILSDPDSAVTGLSRTNTFAHERFMFIEIDLSDAAAVSNLKFPACPGAKKIVLVNNAGAVGHVSKVGNVDNSAIDRLFTVNLTSPAILMNNFMQSYAKENVPLVIMNISSGAGKNPIDGWSSYCASKAGLDMFSRVVAEEITLSGRKDIRIFSIAPGIVDTAMQDEIRRASVANFSRIQQFVDYKITEQLAHPDLTAAKLLSILVHPEKFTETVFSVKDL